MSHIRKGTILQTRNAKYQIVKLLGEGARGQTFLAKVLHREVGAPSRVPAVGAPVVIKLAKIEVDRGRENVEYFIDFVDRRLMAEHRALSALQGLRSIAQLVDIGTYPRTLPGGEVEPRFIVQQFVEGTVLEKAFLERSSPKPFSGIQTAAEWFNLSIA